MRSDTSDKKDFISALRRFAENGGEGIYDPVYKRPNYEPEYRGERTLALGLAKYLENPEVPGDTPGINWYHDLCSHLVDAFEEFRTHEKWDALRKAYKLKTEGSEIPDLVNVHIEGSHRMLVANQLARLVTVLSGELWLQPKLEGYFNAQQACIDQAWERFVRVGYRQLMPRIKKESHRGNKGEFGKTTLMTYAMAGRVMFTFLRGKDGGPTMTYVADDSDLYGVRSGNNFTSTPFLTCVEMINEVSDNWDLKAMKKDTKVGMG